MLSLCQPKYVNNYRKLYPQLEYWEIRVDNIVHINNCIDFHNEFHYVLVWHNNMPFYCNPYSERMVAFYYNHLGPTHPLTLPPQNLKTIFHVKKLLPRVIIHLDGFVWICQRESEWNRSDGSLFNNSPLPREQYDTHCSVTALWGSELFEMLANWHTHTIARSCLLNSVGVRYNNNTTVLTTRVEIGRIITLCRKNFRFIFKFNVKAQ